MSDYYREIVSLLGPLHRQFLELVKVELNCIRDINNVQGMMLFNIGDAEMTVGELTLRGCFLGSNVCYSLKKMVENGYVVQERSEHDRRSSLVRLTDKGRALRDRLSRMHNRQMEMLTHTSITEADLQTVLTTLHKVERLWIRASNQVQDQPSVSDFRNSGTTHLGAVDKRVDP
jgi:DNA-binding MarR family transcriptional regulator